LHLLFDKPIGLKVYAGLYERAAPALLWEFSERMRYGPHEKAREMSPGLHMSRS